MIDLRDIFSNKCEKCACCWEESYYTDCGTEYDCGCTIKGMDYDDHYCFIPYPIRWIRNRRARYLENHQYDDCAEWFEKEQQAGNIFSDFFENELELESQYMIHQLSGDLRIRYDNFLKKGQPRTLKEKWKALIKETYQHHSFYFKSYFCK